MRVCDLSIQRVCALSEICRALHQSLDRLLERGIRRHSEWDGILPPRVRAEWSGCSLMYIEAYILKG